jgi:hypothetical protein
LPPPTHVKAAKQEKFMRSLIQATPAYELSVDIATSAHGHSLRLISFVPTARRPEDHVKFQSVFSTAELKSLRDALNQVLEADLSRLTP